VTLLIEIDLILKFVAFLTFPSKCQRNGFPLFVVYPETHFTEI